MLESMTRKGLTFPRTREGVKYWAAAPFIHGIFENYAIANASSPDMREVAGLMRDYIDGGFFPSGYGMRAIPINDHIESPQKGMVEPFENVKKNIATKERIGIFPCSCNVHSNALGAQCEQNKEVCMAFDFYAEYGIEEYGIGR